MDRSDCFLVKTNAHGEKATYAKFAFSKDELVYTVRGEATNTRTRDSIEVGPGQHVEDDYALFINHSFSPNIEVRGREMIAIADITIGDEITFNYLTSESEISSPFVCHDTGQRVDSAASE